MLSNSKFRTPFSPIIFDYANFLISSGKVEDVSYYGPISARLGWKTETLLKDMKDFWNNSANIKTPFSLDKVTEEAVLAISILLMASPKGSEMQTTFTHYLLGVLRRFSYWKPHFLFKQNVFIETIVTRVVNCLNSVTESSFLSVLKVFVDFALDESANLEYFGNVASYFFRGLLHESSHLSQPGISKLFDECLRLITSEIYDLRTFLPDAPVGTRLNELLRKYFILPAAALASAFNLLRNLEKEKDQVSINCDELCKVLLTYLSAISSFLSSCETHEAELSSLLKLILKMIKVIIVIFPKFVQDSFNIVQLAVQSRINFKNAANYREILSDSCQNLLECSKLDGNLIQNALLCFRDAVISLDLIDPRNEKFGDEINYYETAASIGPYIGALFRLQLDINMDRTLCEGILNSLLSNASEENQNEAGDFVIPRAPSDILVCSHAVATLGHIAGISGDEQIALFCLANLTAQFNKGNYGELSRIFFTQFNLIAVTGSGSLLANILDVYTNIIAEGDLPLVSIAMDELGRSLVSLCKNEMIKMEVLLFTFMRSFIEKGLLLAKNKSSKNSSHHPGLTNLPSPVSSLRPVLFAIWMILEFVVVEDFINKAASIDLFQEFWFVLIFHGFQSQLAWDPLWKDFIARISEKSPLLIKEKDRVQTATTFSLSLLTQQTNSALKGHLISLMPNCTNSSKNLSLAQCLWLFTFYQCESNKLEAGRTDTLLSYLKSDVVYYLDLYPFIEDLTLTILKDWLNSHMIKRHPETTNLALMILKECGNIQKRIHKTCLQFIKLILSRERGLEGCSAIWTGLLNKLDILYKTCRAEMGIKPDPELLLQGDYIKDPEYAKEAFEDVLKFSREVFQTASYLYPHEYYTFVMNYFQADSAIADDLENVSYRNVALLELLKSCHPDSGYFQLPLEMHRNSESHFKWHLFLPKLKKEQLPVVDESLLSVEKLWSNLEKLDTFTIKSLMSFVNQKVILSTDEEAFDVEKVRCLMHLPLLNPEHSLMQFATKIWMLLLTRIPAKFGRSFLLLSELQAAFKLHRSFKLGIFAESGEFADPFKTKMTSTPSKPGKLELGVTVSTYYLYMIDFLRERFLIDSRDQPKCLESYIDLIQELVESTMEFRFHSWSRAARFRIILFAQEILTFIRNFWSESFGTEIYRLKAVIYRSFIDYFEKPKTWSVQSRDLFEYEVRTNTALIDYIERDLVVPLKLHEGSLLQSSLDSLVTSKLSSSYSMPASRAESIPAKPSQLNSPVTKAPVITLRQLLKYFLIHETESIQVWLGTLKSSKMTLPPRAFWREMAAFAREFSPMLSIRFCRMVKMDEDHSLIISPKGQSSKNAFFKYLGSISILEYFISSGIDVPNSDCFLYAEPISPPLALAIFRTSPYKTRPKYLNYAMRSLEAYPPDLLFFYIPQIVQNLRHDENGYTETTIMHIASVSSLFAHQVIWNMKANMYIDDAGTIPDPMKSNLDKMVAKIVSQFQGSERVFYEREFAFFEKVTGISGLLKPFIRKEKWEKKKKIDEELAKIEVDPGVYLPSNPECSVIDIDYSSGRPLQSFAKAPFMATFKVRSMRDESLPATWQSCIFKVGDDCRQDVMTLQLISAVKSIFEMANLNLYLFPYRVVATAPGCGVIEVIPNSISRDMLGREKINSLYEYFWFKYGNPNGIAFQTAREEFIKSMAAYSVITYLLAIRDRHNGNIMIDDQGHVIHIDFGFVLDIAPGGITFEKSPFKLTSEMIQVMGGKEDSSPYFVKFQNYCVEAFLVLRPFAEQLIQLVEGVKESGLPCFKNPENSIRNLRQRFRLDLDEAEARNFFSNLVSQSSENVRTDLYDAYQSYRNGIPY